MIDSGLEVYSSIIICNVSKIGASIFVFLDNLPHKAFLLWIKLNHIAFVINQAMWEL